MRVCRNMLPLPVTGFAESQRRSGRVRCRDLHCSLGEVLDLSAGGMRVRGRPDKALAVGVAVEVALLCSPFVVHLKARIVWVRKSGWRTQELGLMFLDLSAPSRRSLNDLARAVTFLGEIPVPAGPHPV